MFEWFPSAYLFERKRFLNCDLNLLTFFQAYTQKASKKNQKEINCIKCREVKWGLSWH